MKKLIFSTATILLISLSAGAQETNKCSQECGKKCDKKECTTPGSCDKSKCKEICGDDKKCDKKSKKCKSQCPSSAVKPD